MKTQKKNTQRSALALIILALALITGVAKADTITTFNVSGTCSPFAPFTGTTFSGTLTIDVTIGTVTAIDVSFLGFSPFNTISGSNAIAAGGWDVHSQDAAADLLSLNFTTGHTPSSLVGFTGGDIIANISNVVDVSTLRLAYLVDSGSITAPAGVPDGGTTVMLLGAALGALGMTRRFLIA
jgi:hypothetical protein